MATAAQGKESNLTFNQITAEIPWVKNTDTCLMGKTHEDVAEGLRLIFEGIRHLQSHSGTRHRFTIDGRLVGDIGELVAQREFEIRLDDVSRSEHDAIIENTQQKVQIKAGFKRSLTFRKIPQFYIGLRLSEDGSHEVIYNGPGIIIADAIRHREGFDKNLLSISMHLLRKLNETVPENMRVPMRKISE